ncbi:MAG TPA: hypothetical protein PLD48_03070 [Bacillota bacterium]|nr:hypothetical protein [Bacillota bacterium]HOK69198.1 hypothetical protein [Bacillota bacterium]HPP84651.1 hypothetical protein [Bacillota bacterium]
MRIVVRSKERKNIHLRFPTRMLFNGFTGTIGAGIVNKHIGTDSGYKLRASDLRRLMREINRIKKKHPKLDLVEVHSADGDEVKITL